MSVLALDITYDVTPKLAWTEKLAYRVKDTASEIYPTVTTHTSLMIHRLDYALPKAFGIGTEYRILEQEEAKDQRSGWLTEVTWEAKEHLRLGVGFNFTEFSDDLYQENDYEEQGWFIRVQGIW